MCLTQGTQPLCYRMTGAINYHTEYSQAFQSELSTWYLCTYYATTGFILGVGPITSGNASSIPRHRYTDVCV